MDFISELVHAGYRLSGKQIRTTIQNRTRMDQLQKLE